MKVFINGQSYDEWSQLPPEIKQQLAATLPDNDHNGVPDVFEGVLPTATPGAPGAPQAFTSTVINVNGQQYGSVAELPDEIKQTLQSVFGTAFGAATTGAAPLAPGVVPPATAVPGQVPGASGVPGPGQIILNGQAVQVGAEPPAKKGFLRRIFGG